jgi:hypothetical protein
MSDSSHNKFEDNFQQSIQSPSFTLSIVPAVTYNNPDCSKTSLSNDGGQTTARIPNERRQDKIIAKEINFALTDEHIAQLESLNLDIHINKAIFAIDCLVNAENENSRLSLNEAVYSYCSHQQETYNLWLLKVQEFAKKHNITIVSVISILDDVAIFNELHWSSGMKRRFVSKFKTEFNENGKIYNVF